MRIQSNESNNGFYELEQIRSIPIVEVCKQMLQLPVEERGNNYWCKIRDERTASTILHPENNTFHDFGSGKGGNVISFVAYACEIEPAVAIQKLAEAFHIPRLNPREGMDPNALTDWEYKQIGLYGDRATKNFTWDFDNTPIERISELEQKYSVPMNTFRKKYPRLYEQILRQKALPHIYNLRNDYYLNVRSSYQLVKEVGNVSLFNPDEFSSQIKALLAAEKLMERATAGTSFNFVAKTDYEPLRDAEMLERGEVTPSLGNVTKAQLQVDARAKKTQVRYRNMDYTKYVLSDIGQNSHMAFLKGDKVIVGFLASDYAKFKSFFEQAPSPEREGLDKQISTAEHKQTAVGAFPPKGNEAER